MAFSIRAGKLYSEGKAVETIASTYKSGKFNPTPKIIVMHFTYGSTARSSANWFRDRKNTGSSAHVVVDRDGSVIQCVEFDTIAWHAGKSRLRNMIGMNQHAIGIELANWGYLQPNGSGWKSYTGIPIVDPVMAAHKYGNPVPPTDGPIGWEAYPPEQMKSALQIARVLVSTYGMTEIVGHEDIARGRKWDPGPAFDMRRFRDAIFGGRGDNGDARMRVATAEGLNLRKGAGIGFDALQTLPLGTVLEPVRQDGHWMEVSVINAAGNPSATGWVHTHYLEDA